jgi:hypothetical protein
MNRTISGFVTWPLTGALLVGGLAESRLPKSDQQQRRIIGSPEVVVYQAPHTPDTRVILYTERQPAAIVATAATNALLM